MVVKYIKPGINVSKLFCDKVSFVINYKSPDARTFVSKKLTGLQNANHKWAFASNKGLYQKGIVLKEAPEGIEGTMLLLWSPWNEKTSFLRVEYNPNIVATHHWKWLFDSILPGGYGDVLARAKITRCDFAVDVTGVHLRGHPFCSADDRAQHAAQSEGLFASRPHAPVCAQPASAGPADRLTA
nr:hypothetical protein [Ralstonia mannitolilytica]